MITKIQNRYSIDSAGNKRVSADFYCLSTDALPETASNADKLYEMDTGITRHFNEETGAWIPPRSNKSVSDTESTETFTILSYRQTVGGMLYEVFADSVEGFGDFIDLHGDTAVPGSTVDVADTKAVFRLRNDGSWQEYARYANSEEEATALTEAATEMVLDDLIPDDAIIGESEESA